MSSSVQVQAQVEEVLVFNGELLLLECQKECAKKFAESCVRECARQYGFDGDRAIAVLNLSSLKVVSSSKVGKVLKDKVVKEKVVKVGKVKSLFPLPYSGGCNVLNCDALRHNGGLYTQCDKAKKEGGDYCDGCAKKMMQDSRELPISGTIK